MGLRYPDSVKASHVNYLRANAPTAEKHPLLAAQHASTPYNETEKRGMERTKWFKTEGQ